MFSLEMSAEQLVTRVLSEQSQVTAEQIRTGNIGRQEFASLRPNRRPRCTAFRFISTTRRA